MTGTFIEFLTWDDLEVRMQTPQTFIIPVGARLKQHGLHLQLNNDYVLAQYLVKKVTERLDVLARPTVPSVSRGPNCGPANIGSMGTFCRSSSMSTSAAI